MVYKKKEVVYFITSFYNEEKEGILIKIDNFL